MNYAVCIPTYNGGAAWREAASALRSTVSSEARVVVVDSDSTDGTDAVSLQMGFEVIRIKKADFDHGGTRQLLVDHILGNAPESDAESEGIEYLVFITQDSVLEQGAIDKLLQAFEDPEVMVAYGRQLPKREAGLLESHARLYNYPQESMVKDQSTARQLGFKTVFSSNSFAAYRVSALKKLGGFSDGTVCSEDVRFAAKAVAWGGRVAYVAEARTRHSHDFTLAEEFGRAFDIGAFHAMEPWIMARFGAVFGEGLRFLFSQARYTAARSPRLVAKVFLSCAVRYVGYSLGKRFRFVFPSIRPVLGANKGFWMRRVDP